ncbi:MAG: hypothetical protein ACLQLC_20720 [Candidatus Sulfotelmatobacter sp.]
MSSTANAQLVEFPLTLNSLTLTSQSGKTVSLFSAPASAEFIHLNGNLEPLATVSIPQDIYTSASAVYGGSAPVCVGLASPSSGGVLVDGALNGTGTPTVTVNLPDPITVTGAAMGLILNLQVSQSAPFSGGCVQNLSVPVSPVFDLTPLVIAAQPTNSANGKALGLEGAVASVGATGNGFTASAPYGYFNGYTPKWQVSTDASTVFQGIGSVSGLSAGMPVDMDVALQADGSLMATWVAVYETDTTNLSVASGPPFVIYPSGYGSVDPVMDALEVEQEGDLPGLYDIFSGLDAATSQISGQFTNVQNLPFAATFNAANIVAGQNVLVTSNAPSVDGFPALPLPLATMTLMPQVINGTVSEISMSGGFTTYNVTLAPYDLFPTLAVQPGQTTLLINPNTVVAYADSNTQMLNSSAVGVGGIFRFYGLVFNDNGALRMDCAQINDGVAE